MTEISEHLKIVMEACYGDRGAFACEAFEQINETLFAGQLPYPLITWQITPHGRCLGWSQSDPGKVPMVCIHPSMLGDNETTAPWGIPPALLGYPYAYDVLIHECIHISVRYRLGGQNKPTSHNNPEWVSEVNRIAPLLGWDDIEAGLSKSQRVRNGESSKVVRASGGNLTHLEVAAFPDSIRQSRGEWDFYLQSRKQLLERNAIPDAPPR